MNNLTFPYFIDDLMTEARAGYYDIGELGIFGDIDLYIWTLLKIETFNSFSVEEDELYNNLYAKINGSKIRVAMSAILVSFVRYQEIEHILYSTPDEVKLLAKLGSIPAKLLLPAVVLRSYNKSI